VPIEQIAPSGAAYWYHHDQLGSTRALTDSSGTPQATYTYDSYGNVRASTGTIRNPLRFAGQYVDAESGLVYLRARYYDPVTAQFVSVDPLVATTGARYSYASGSPLNAWDPSGLVCTMNNPDFPGMCVDNGQIPPATGGGSPQVDFNGCPIGPKIYQCPPPPKTRVLCFDGWNAAEIVQSIGDIVGYITGSDPVIPPIPRKILNPPTTTIPVA
jgi:RHS repeat-associated protein